MQTLNDATPHRVNRSEKLFTRKIAPSRIVMSSFHRSSARPVRRAVDGYMSTLAGEDEHEHFHSAASASARQVTYKLFLLHRP